MSKEQNNIFWGEKVAKQIIEKYPNIDTYTTAAGISPSGIVHFGNLRDLITSFIVADSIKRLGKESRILFSWDEYDRFRKVPKNIPADFEQYIGMPLSKVPDPKDCHESYAKHFEADFEDAIHKMGIEVDFKYQGDLYQSGFYTEHILTALQRRKEIAEILYSHMSEKGIKEKKIDKEEYIENYYPIRIYSRFSEKDNTEILSYDGESTVTYMCHDTKQEDTVNLIKDHRIKLGWKVDWAMRWMHENVIFEPGGPDHAAPGSSFKVSGVIANKIFNYHAPEFVEYKFVGLQGQGSKMSGSKGNAVTPLELLDIYTSSLLKWIYTRKNPGQSFSVALNSEIYRQYDEFDRAVKRSVAMELEPVEERQIDIAFDNVREERTDKPFSMRQAVALGQIVQWNTEKVKEIAENLGMDADEESIEQRVHLGKNWLTKYNPDEMITLRSDVNEEYVQTLSDEARGYIHELKEVLEKGINDIKELEKNVYGIPKDESLSLKENSPLQRAFFKDVYNLLIGKDTGPRLSTFLWAVDRKKVLELLNI